jgi:hypothetical protein
MLSLRKQPTERRGFFNRSLPSAARKGLAAFVDPVQFCQKQLLQRFVHQVAESAERPVEFSEMTIRDQLQARPLLRQRNVSFALGLAGRVCIPSEGGYRGFPCGRRSSSDRAPQETVLYSLRQSQRRRYNRILWMKR